MKKNKILIIISSVSHKSKLISTLKTLEKNKNDEIILLGVNSEFKNKLGENVVYKKLEDYNILQNLKNLDEKSILWLKSWSNSKIYKNQNFKEITSYKKTSLWWLVELWFFYVSSFNFYPIIEIIKNVEIVQHIIETENPSRVIIFDDKCLIGKVFTLVAKCKKIQISSIQTGMFSNAKYSILNHSIPFFVKSFKNLKSFLREFAEKISFLYKNKTNRFDYKHKILMVTHPTYRQLTIDSENNQRINEDSILGPVIREIKKNKKNEIVLTDTDPFRAFRFRFLFDKNYKHIEGYLSRTAKKVISKKTKELSKKWEGLKRSKSFAQSLTYKNIPLLELLENKFSELFHRKLVESIKYIEMIDEAIKKEKPDITIVIDEYGLYGRAAVVSSKINKIPTLAIQHGIIGPRHFGYYHTKDEISNKNIIEPKYCPIPDKTAVIGNYYRSILLNRGFYPSDRVVTVGQPKYDVLAFADKIYKKEKIYDELKIKTNKKLIVFASQTDILNINEILFRSLFRAIKEMPNTQLVIKLHPVEHDTSLHKKIAREVGINIIMVRDVDLSELLYACDLMITFNSTVAIEAMILNKPVITINLSNYPDEMPFAESGAAIGVYKVEDVKTSIIKTLEDKNHRKKLEIKRKQFVFKHAYKIDGKASKRIADLINYMLEESANS